MELIQKLAILADAAKYDASCASSGTRQRDSRHGGGMGSTEGMGICHSYAPDGRCISLLKILLTNFCVYDCLYCVNRHSSNVPRARFSVAEVVALTLNFYQRNYIEGLFLSSGIIRDPDYTMEQLVLVARTLREQHQFQGYIHLKTIPDADPQLLDAAGHYADRLSINVELPSREGLTRLAPEKDRAGIERAMGHLWQGIEAGTEGSCRGRPAQIAAMPKPARVRRRPRAFAPAGQSTQMIIGADDSSDHLILHNSYQLYQRYRMRRVYYSAFSPIPDAHTELPPQAPPLLREHRLYQADWLLRFYGFGLEELVDPGEQTMLDLDIDPKLAWALRHRERFPLDINRAERQQLLRIPGLGPRNVQRILSARRFHRLGLADLKALRVSLAKVKPFIITRDYRPPLQEPDTPALRRQLSATPATPQLSLF
ncbi:MAG: putative DNA modification/repair radical SAM protein [Pseudomonadales bacterium]|nr:putative DNA modification/repair radical SAM protein [Pseudomonadales bacterium]